MLLPKVFCKYCCTRFTRFFWCTTRLTSGSTDATNCLPASTVACTVVSSLGYDHQNVLGDTLAEIAFEKSGIFQPLVPCLTVPQPPEAIAVLEQRAKQLASFELVSVAPLPPSLPVRLGLDGEHQRLNAALAVASVQTWLHRAPASRHRAAAWLPQLPWLQSPLPTSTLVSVSVPEPLLPGLQQCTWPGRCQTLALPSADGSAAITLQLDGAHTAESMVVARDWFLSSPPAASERTVLWFNCHTSRNPAVLLAPFADCGGHRFDLVLFSCNITGLGHVLEDQRDPAPSSDFQHKVAGVWRALNNETRPDDVDSRAHDSVATPNLSNSECRQAFVCSNVPVARADTSISDHQQPIVCSNVPAEPSISQGDQQPTIVCSDVPSALSELRRFAALGSSDVRVLVCGSLYLVGAVLELLQPPFRDSSMIDAAPLVRSP
eukprot:TRINITY_DN14172_c0_g1_i1.p1 TRINITY_DN14172_c0_g1~~TRINITY_DN14172_c0_g1_i1.p1  ORF type:complete len:434 (+),score=100.84 TRINITY_DN14172_c0_g1_i1:116-1417(+)